MIHSFIDTPLGVPPSQMRCCVYAVYSVNGEIDPCRHKLGISPTVNMVHVADKLLMPDFVSFKLSLPLLARMAWAFRG